MVRWNARNMNRSRWKLIFVVYTKIKIVCFVYLQLMPWLNAFHVIIPRFRKIVKEFEGFHKKGKWQTKTIWANKWIWNRVKQFWKIRNASIEQKKEIMIMAKLFHVVNTNIHCQKRVIECYKRFVFDVFLIEFKTKTSYLMTSF